MKSLPAFALLALMAVPAIAQEGPNVATLSFESVANPLKYSIDQNLGEVLSVAVNSKGHLIVLNHPGTATAGPVYGNATTQIFEFDIKPNVPGSEANSLPKMENGTNH